MELMVMQERVIVSESGITIVDLQVKRRDVAEFLRNLTSDEVESTVVRALEVGVFCLERARMNQDTEFVRRQLDMLLSRVDATVAKIPETTQKALLEKIGTKDGQVLSPIKAMIDSASSAMSEKLRKFESCLKTKSIRGKKAPRWGVL
jgi:hypothetical protein